MAAWCSLKMLSLNLAAGNIHVKRHWTWLAPIHLKHTELNYQEDADWHPNPRQLVLCTVRWGS